MTKKANVDGRGWARFRCMDCGVVTTRKKSWAVAGTRKRGDAAARKCRNAQACAQRKVARANESILDAE